MSFLKRLVHPVVGALAVAVGIAGGPLGLALFGAKASAIIAAGGYFLKTVGVHLGNGQPPPTSAGSGT